MQFVLSSARVFLLVCSIPAFLATVYAHDSCEDSLWGEDRWDRQSEIALTRLLENIHPEGTAPGVVVASPSQKDPNYFFDWVRDTMLVWKTLLKIKDSGHFPEFHALLPGLAEDLVRAQYRMQLNGPGEPKHHVDLTAFTGPWGRPQNDGPGLRMQIMVELLKRGLLNSKAEALALSILRVDLAYLQSVIEKPDFEPWEEVQGYHFYNRLQIAKGAYDAAELFSQTGQFQKALDPQPFRALYERVLPRLREHLADTGPIKPTFRTGGLDSKHSDLDITVLLAHLHADFPQWWEVKVDDPRLMVSVTDLLQSFEVIYPINRHGLLGIMSGRYPEDIYDGNGFDGGNPWFLSTLAVAEYYDRLADHWAALGEINVNDQNIASLRFIVNRYHPEFALDVGTFHKRRKLLPAQKEYLVIMDSLRMFVRDQMRRTLYHVAGDGSMSEQSSRINGTMRGAPHLSWSYGAYLRTYLEIPRD